MWLATLYALKMVSYKKAVHYVCKNKTMGEVDSKRMKKDNKSDFSWLFAEKRNK